MSLEDSIQKLTVAVENLTKTITTLNVTPAAVPTPPEVETLPTKAVAVAELQPETPAEVEAPKKPRKKAAAPEVATVAEPEPASATTPEPAPAPEPAKITLQEIRELAQVALDNDKLSGVIAINKKFGLRRISEATEDQYAEIHELLSQLTNGAS
jgi:hypothetical protein